jgi:CheY-like chemotaxis protein
MYDLDELIKHTQDLTLLYVEDNKDARESTLLILEHLFDNIVVAVDGEDGLNKFKENNNIDLIISDISMPKMDGIEMCREIKKIKRDQAIIILTAIIDIAIIKEAIDIGIDSFINKPMEDVELLFAKIEKSIKQIEYEKNKKQIENLKHKKEKVDIILKIIQNLSHHWKQPLSVISTISSTCSFKLENDIAFEKDDYKEIDIITEKTKELSTIFEKLENLDFEKVTIEEIEDILYINNPIYKD